MDPEKLNGDKMTQEIIGKQPNTYTATKVNHYNVCINHCTAPCRPWARWLSSLKEAVSQYP